METRLFHIFRNTPMGRETLLQSLYFCQKVGASLTVYIPKFTKFLMYFENDVVQIDLDESYLTAPKTALQHVRELADAHDMSFTRFEPKNYTASTLPDIPTNYDFMCCPRSISDLSTKIGLGYIGPRVRRILSSARFPVIVTSPAFKPWTSISVFFGGSTNAIKALRLGFRIQRNTGMDLRVFTQAEDKPFKAYQGYIDKENLSADMERYVKEWRFFGQGEFEQNLYEVPHDSLVILGAFGHSLIKDIIFGSKMEKIQSVISNNLLIVGPKYTASS